MKRLLIYLKNFIASRFNLFGDKQDDDIIIENTRKEVVFKGANVWTLVFAIFIASIGLNVNSTAVIIGAMLISPLMGPIIGIGLSIGINDIGLLKKGLLNLAIATCVSIATSSLYFAISPLHDASSELLARTQPTIWDVFIALFGGLAGIVAVTRKEKTNVIPGVAIATALMPPLCTAGYGLATGQWFYFLGALYLFFINSLFICLATFLIVKHLKFKPVHFSTPEREKKISRLIFVLVLLTILPSIYLAYRLVQKSIFTNNITKFIQAEFEDGTTQVAKHNSIFDGKKQAVELLLIGQPLSADEIDTLRKRMPAYGLEKTQLVVHQGVDAEQMMEHSSNNSKTLAELNARINALTAVQHRLNNKDFKKEVQALFPQVQEFSFTPGVIVYSDSTRIDTLTLFTARFEGKLTNDEMAILTKWLNVKAEPDSIKVIIE